MNVYFSYDSMGTCGSPQVAYAECNPNLVNAILSEGIFLYFPADLQGKCITIGTMDSSMGSRVPTDNKHGAICEDICKYGTVLSYAPVSFDYNSGNWRDKMYMGGIWNGADTGRDEKPKIMSNNERCIMRVRTSARAYCRLEKAFGIQAPWSMGNFRRDNAIEFFIHIACSPTKNGKVLTKLMFCGKPVALIMSDNCLTNNCLNNILRGTAINQRRAIWLKEGRKAVTALRELRQEDLYKSY